MSLRIEVTPQVYLSEIRREDVAALVLHLADRGIYENTLRIPFPYGREHGRDWIERVASERKRLGRQVTYAIREAGGLLIGAAGFAHVEGPHPHKAELGYWLARPYWGRGTMTGVVARLCDIGFGEMHLLRIYASVYAHNRASARVLEKNGFVLEGLCRKAEVKDGHPIDTLLYARVV